MHSPRRVGKISSRSICVRPLSLLEQIAEQVGELSMAQLTRKPVFWVRADACSNDACVHRLQRRERVSLPSAYSDTLCVRCVRPVCTSRCTGIRGTGRVPERAHHHIYCSRCQHRAALRVPQRGVS